MPHSNGSALALASRLRALSDPELHTLLRLRDVREAGIRDFFDLADKLLDRASIQSTLTQLDRRTLHTLSVIAELSTNGRIADAAAVAEIMDASEHPHTAVQPSTVANRAVRLSERALIAIESDGYVCYDAVAEQLATWPSLGLPGAEALAAPIPAALNIPSEADESAIDHFAAERSFATTLSVVELVAELLREPARELARGGLGQPDTKRLAAAAGVNVDLVPAIAVIAARAGLISLVAGRWTPTAAASEWVIDSTAKRWGRLAGAWVRALPDDIRFVLADTELSIWGEHFDDYLGWLYPAADARMRARIDAHVLTAELLGIFSRHAPSHAGTALLTDGQAAAEAAIAVSLPAEVEQVYLQHDLSIVAPGPLAPALDARLRTMADVEGRALASSYRVTADSVNRALAAGESAASILEFLRSISLTGIPQPLDYLVSESAGRFGLLRVGTVTDGAGGEQSYLRSTDANLLATVLVDQTLAPLALRRAADGRATSRFTRDVVYWSLADARYPAAAESATGQIIIVERHGYAREAAHANDPKPKDAAATIVERMRANTNASEADSATPWLERQLELAIKARITLRVTVAMPDGTNLDYVLEPASLSNGRLRARDRKADIERTLPLSRIVAVSDSAGTDQPAHTSRN
jgi:hypothetical protein